MKVLYFTLLLMAASLTSCFSPSKIYQQAVSPVNFQFEEGSTVIDKSYCTSTEKTTDGLYIFKRYYPTTSVMTEKISYKDKAMTIKQGETVKYYDDETLWSSIIYVDNVANGPARINNSRGQFRDGYRVGNWQNYLDGQKISSYNYNEKGQMHGPDSSWTKEGELASTRLFENGQLVDEKFYAGEEVEKFKVVESMPLFISEDCQGIENDSLKKACADRAMLMEIYMNVKYPNFARENGIEGTALISFVVEKDGSIAEVKALNGVCDEIKAECLRIVNGFPKWQPGYQNGEAVRVQFNLPIRFRLE